MNFFHGKPLLYKLLFWISISAIIPFSSGITAYFLQESGYLGADVQITVKGYRDWGTEKLFLLIDGEVVDSYFVGLKSIGWWTLHDAHTLSIKFSFENEKVKPKERHSFQVIGQNGEETNIVSKECIFGERNQIYLSMEEPSTGYLNVILNTTATYPNQKCVFTLSINDYPVYSEEKMYYTHLSASIFYGSWELISNKNYTIQLVTIPPTAIITHIVNVGPGESQRLTLIL